MTNQEIVDNITKQPVGRATLVVNDKCGDPTNYLYKLNYLALHSPDLVKAMAISVLQFKNSKPSYIRDMVDMHYRNHGGGYPNTPTQ